MDVDRGGGRACEMMPPYYVFGRSQPQLQGKLMLREMGTQGERGKERNNKIIISS